MVEIVEVVVVAKQHRVDMTDRRRGKRGTLGLSQRVHRQLVTRPRGIERRIGQQANAAPLEQRRRPTEICERDNVAAHTKQNAARTLTLPDKAARVIQ
jgi:hypothetical protein